VATNSEREATIITNGAEKIDFF